MEGRVNKPVWAQISSIAGILGFQDILEANRSYLAEQSFDVTACDSGEQAILDCPRAGGKAAVERVSSEMLENA